MTGVQTCALPISVPIGGTPIKIATLNDPDGNLIELMELPKGLDHLPH